MTSVAGYSMLDLMGEEDAATATATTTAPAVRVAQASSIVAADAEEAPAVGKKRKKKAKKATATAAAATTVMSDATTVLDPSGVVDADADAEPKAKKPKTREEKPKKVAKKKKEAASGGGGKKAKKASKKQNVLEEENLAEGSDEEEIAVSKDVHKQAEEQVVELLEEADITPLRTYVDSDDESDTEDEAAGPARRRRQQKEKLPLLGKAVNIEEANTKISDEMKELQAYVRKAPGMKEVKKLLGTPKFSSYVDASSTRNLPTQALVLYKALNTRGQKEMVTDYVKRLCKEQPAWDEYASKNVRAWQMLKMRCEELPRAEALLVKHEEGMKGLPLLKQAKTEEEKTRVQLANAVRAHLKEYVVRILREAEQWVLVVQQNLWSYVDEAVEEGVNVVKFGDAFAWEEMGYETHATLAEAMDEHNGGEPTDWLPSVLDHTDEMNKHLDILLGKEGYADSDEESAPPPRGKKRDPTVMYDTESDEEMEDVVDEEEEEEGVIATDDESLPSDSEDDGDYAIDCAAPLDDDY